MGCICSKAIGISIPRKEQEKISKSLKRQPTATAFAIEISTLHNGTTTQKPQRNNEYILTRSISKTQENSIVLPQLAIFEGKNNVPVPIIIDGQLPPPQRSSSTIGHSHKAAITTTAADIGRPDDSESIRGESELVAAGWPSWLASVAGDAIRGLVPRRADTFTKFDKIGQGTYSSVFKARDLETGKIVALKKVRFVNMDPESVRFMAREIHVLRKLDHPNVIKLEGLIASTNSDNLYLVFEYMEHDLAGLAATPGIKFTEPQVKCYIQQLLNGLKHCHSRGVLHRDIKGSNLLLDNNGVLKIADFGLAATVVPNQNQQLTSRVVTLWYRPPELLLGSTEYGASVDLWSTGCILAEILAGKPIMPGRTEVEQMHKIFKLCGSPSEEYWKKTKLSNPTIFRPQHLYRRCVRETFREFPSSALDLLDVLLAIKPEDRGTSGLALRSEFFTTKPYACDPTSLPKYPPSKELDAKIRDEVRRKRTEGVQVNGSEYSKNGLRETKGIMDSTARGPSSLEKTQTQVNAYRSDRIENGGTQTNNPHTGKSRNGLLFNSNSSLHPYAAFGSSWTTKTKNKNDTQSSFSRSSSSSVRLPEFKSQGSGNYLPRTTDIVDFSILPARKEEKISAKEPSSLTGYQTRKIHYSGPLMPPGGNIEDMLKEHERQIQLAVRKARLGKARSEKNH